MTVQKWSIVRQLEMLYEAEKSNTMLNLVFRFSTPAYCSLMQLKYAGILLWTNDWLGRVKSVAVDTLKTNVHLDGNFFQRHSTRVSQWVVQKTSATFSVGISL